MGGNHVSHLNRTNKIVLTSSKIINKSTRDWKKVATINLYQPVSGLLISITIYTLERCKNAQCCNYISFIFIYLFIYFLSSFSYFLSLSFFFFQFFVFAYDKVTLKEQISASTPGLVQGCFGWYPFSWYHRCYYYHPFYYYCFYPLPNDYKFHTRGNGLS